MLFSISAFSQVKIEIIGNYFVATENAKVIVNHSKDNVRFIIKSPTNPASFYTLFATDFDQTRSFLWTDFRTSTGVAFASQSVLNSWLYANTGTTVSAGGSSTSTSDATAALQTAGNNLLNSIDIKTPALVNGNTPVQLSAAQIVLLTPQTNGLTNAQLRATPIDLPIGASTSALQGSTNGFLNLIDNSLNTIKLKDFATESTLLNVATTLNDVTTDVNGTALGGAKKLIVAGKRNDGLYGTLPLAGYQERVNDNADKTSLTVGGYNLTKDRFEPIPIKDEAIPIINGNLPLDVYIVGGVSTSPTDYSTAPLQVSGNLELTAIKNQNAQVVANTNNTATSVSAINAKTPALGQALAVASVPVVLPTAQIADLKATRFLLASTDGVAATQIGNWNVNQLQAQAGYTKLTTGINDASIKAAGSPATIADNALVVDVRFAPPLTSALKGTSIAQGITATNLTVNTSALDNFVQGSVNYTTPGTTITNEKFSLIAGSDGNASRAVRTSSNGYLFNILTDGTNFVTVKPSNTAATVTDNPLVVAISPINNVAVNQTQINGVAVATNSGVNGLDTQRVTIATNDLLVNSLFKNGQNIGQINNALPPGSNNIGSIQSITGTVPTATGSLSTEAATLAIINGGSSQILFSQNLNRKYFEIFNNSNQVIWMRLTSNALVGSGIPVAANGGYYKGFSLNQITITGQTTGQAFYATQN